MTSNTKILKQTIELLTGELKQAGEYRDNAVRCGVELNKQLAAMTTRAERIESSLAAMTAERDTLRRDHNGCALWAHASRCKRDALKAELAAMTARAELAERQVAVLMPFVKMSGCCPEGKQDTCSHSVKCNDCWAAWARAEAVKEGGKG
jgi:hypothetical protein